MLYSFLLGGLSMFALKSLFGGHGVPRKAVLSYAMETNPKGPIYCPFKDSGSTNTIPGIVPRGSRYLIIKELGLKDHDDYGFWGPKSLIIWYLDPLKFLEPESLNGQYMDPPAPGVQLFFWVWGRGVESWGEWLVLPRLVGPWRAYVRTYRNMYMCVYIYILYIYTYVYTCAYICISYTVYHSLCIYICMYVHVCFSRSCWSSCEIVYQIDLWLMRARV